jgi:hypothetical protein
MKIMSLLEKSFERECDRFAFLKRFVCPISPLIYPNNSEIGDEEGVLILPPSDYWVLKTTLNVQSAKEAKKYAPALFDLGEGYRYEAQKIEPNLFILIAYSPLALSSKWAFLFDGTHPSQITFAQWVFSDITAPIRLKNGKCLSLHDGIVLEMEERYVDTASTIDIEDALQQPKRYKRIKTEKIVSASLSPKTLTLSLVILILLLANSITDTLFTYQAIEELDAKNSALLEEYHLGATSIEREAVLNSLKQKEKKQFHLRTQSLTLKNIPIKVSKGAVITPPLPLPPVLPSLDGVVLIPGSKPGESNRLLVDRGQNPAPSLLSSEGIKELNYDGKNIKIIMETVDAEHYKKLFLNYFKQAKIEHHNNQLEVRLK